LISAGRRRESVQRGLSREKQEEQTNSGFPKCPAVRRRVFAKEEPSHSKSTEEDLSSYDDQNVDRLEDEVWEQQRESIAPKSLDFEGVEGRPAQAKKKLIIMQGKGGKVKGGRNEETSSC